MTCKYQGETYYFDWSIKRGILALKESAHELEKHSNTRQFLHSIPCGSTIISEATFESFNTKEQGEVIDLAEKLGHIWLCTPTRVTGRKRRELFPDKDFKVIKGEALDEYDVWALRALALDGKTHLRKPRKKGDVDPEFVERSDKTRSILMILRKSPKPTNDELTDFYKTGNAKEYYVRKLSKCLPPIKELTEERKLYVGNGNGTVYAPPLLAAVGVAANHARNRTEFERLIGLYHHGYPTIARSEIMFHVWNNQVKKRPGSNLTGFRREVRWLYHSLKDNGVEYPVEVLRRTYQNPKRT